MSVASRTVLFKRIAQGIVAVLGVLMLASVALTLFGQWSGGRRLDEFCTAIRPGMPVASLAEAAAGRELRLTLPGIAKAERRWHTFARDSMARGEHCEIEHDGERVVRASRGSLP